MQIIPLAKPHTAFEIVRFGAIIGEEIQKIAPNKIIPEHNSIITEIVLPVEILGKSTAITPTERIKQSDARLSFGLRKTRKISTPISAKIQPVPIAEGTLPTRVSKTPTRFLLIELP